jgi:hypothetical protein
MRYVDILATNSPVKRLSLSEKTESPKSDSIGPIDAPDLKLPKNAGVVNLDLHNDSDKETLAQLHQLLKSNQLPFTTTNVTPPTDGKPGKKAQTLQLTINTEGP